jgi:hypothetical protein
MLLSQETLDAIQAEATEAHLKHGSHSMMGRQYTSAERLVILVEEVGEVAHELTYDQSAEGLITELIQVAAMAATWIEYLTPEAVERTSNVTITVV